MNRKEFIVGCTAGMALFASAPLRMLAKPFPTEKEQIFVLIFLRGGCDGLNLLAPSSDQVYQDARPSQLKVGKKGKSAGLLLGNPLNDIGFRLHSKAPELKELYDQGDLALLHACGLKNGTRSHFVAMDLIERGLHRKLGSAEGWMSRYFKQTGSLGLIPAATTSGAMPQAMSDFGKAVSISDLKEFNLLEFMRHPDLLRKWYQGNNKVASVGRTTLDTIALIEKQMNLNSNHLKRNRKSEYPEHGIGANLSKSLKTMATMIKLEVGLKIGQVDFGGWDTHEHQQYYFPGQVEALSKAIAAFYNDLHAYHGRLTVLVMSEFGRRLRSNRSQGTDHGYGNMMMVLGGGVNGGRMYGKWPGLSTKNLDKGVDLSITTDYRSVLGEILIKKLGLPNLDSVFPGFQEYKKIGFFKH